MNQAVTKEWWHYRYTDRDVRDYPELTDLAKAYLTTYTGDFEYLRDAQRALVQVGGLPSSIVRGVLNCMRTDPRALPGLAMIARPSAPVDMDTVPTNKSRLAPCENKSPHYGHSYGPEWRMRCEGVPFDLDRDKYAIDVVVKYPFAKARTGKLIHRVGEGSYCTWFPNAHSLGFIREPELTVKTVCKYPSWIQRPVLIKSLDNWEIFPDPEVKICQHCKELAE